MPKAHKPASTARRRSPSKAPSGARSSDARDRNRMRVAQARSAVMSAILAIEGKGVFGDVALMLRSSALTPLSEVSL